jgi:hypothetical protein
MLILIWALAATLWAAAVTFILVRHPLPLPDRGHRAFALASEEARLTVLRVLRESGLKEWFTFESGPTRQTLLSDGYTVLNHLDKSDSGLGDLPGNAISLAVRDPRAESKRAAAVLKAANFSARVEEITDAVLPPNHLLVLESNAFEDWVLVFRRHIFRMPKVERQRVSQ